MTAGSLNGYVYVSQIAMNKLTPRGYLVAGILLGLALAALYWISGHVWYVPGEGYCIGTILECYGPDFH